jgi:hypothetical protein
MLRPTLGVTLNVGHGTLCPYDPYDNGFYPSQSILETPPAASSQRWSAAVSEEKTTWSISIRLRSSGHSMCVTRPLWKTWTIFSAISRTVMMLVTGGEPALAHQAWLLGSPPEIFRRRPRRRGRSATGSPSRRCWISWSLRAR